MQTQVMFDGRAGVLDANSEERRVGRSIYTSFADGTAIELSLHHDLPAIEAEWRAFEESADCTVFQTFDWLATWHRNIGVHEGAKPAIVIGRLQGAILFLLPFASETQRGIRKITWLGSHLSNYNGPMVVRDFSQRLSAPQFAEVWRDIKRLLRERLSPDLIDLEKMPVLIGEQDNPFCALRSYPHVNDAHLSTLTGNWDAYYEAQRSSATRKTDRKKRKRLADQGEIKFITAKSRDDVVHVVDALIDEKRQLYAKLGVANMFDWPGYRDFFIDLASAEQSSRLTHVSCLDVGAATTAANFALMFRGRYYYILAGYDDGDLARFGPGSIQLMELLRYAIEHGCSVFDFTVGDEPYKREWCDAELRLCDYVTPVSTRGAAVAAMTIAFRRTKRGIKRNARIWALTRKARSLLGALRS